MKWADDDLLVRTAPSEGGTFALVMLETVLPVGAQTPHDLKSVNQSNQHQDFKVLARAEGW